MTKIFSDKQSKKLIGLTKIQKLIGKRMLASKQSKPCFYIKAKADVTELMAIRPKLRKKFGVKIIQLNQLHKNFSPPDHHKSCNIRQAYIPAATSSSPTPQPAGSFSIWRTGGGLIISNRRNNTKPIRPNVTVSLVSPGFSTSQA